MHATQTPDGVDHHEASDFEKKWFISKDNDVAYLQ
jgi:hypothetical protein